MDIDFDSGFDFHIDHGIAIISNMDSDKKPALT